MLYKCFECSESFVDVYWYQLASFVNLITYWNFE